MLTRIKIVRQRRILPSTALRQTDGRQYQLPAIRICLDHAKRDEDQSVTESPALPYTSPASSFFTSVAVSLAEQSFSQSAATAGLIAYPSLLPRSICNQQREVEFATVGSLCSRGRRCAVSRD